MSRTARVDGHDRTADELRTMARHNRLAAGKLVSATVALPLIKEAERYEQLADELDAAGTP